ncbi:MAG: aldose epimerase family protein [Clostridia bacterium]
MRIISLGKSATGIEGFRLENESGVSVEIITYGARIHKLIVPDKNGLPVDVVAGFNNFDDYREKNPYLNAVIGRVANRIGNASFELGGKRYNLYKNNGENHLHGGQFGFDKKLWQATVVDDKALRLSYVSVAEEEGYPANLKVEVIYSLDNGTLNIDYFATSDGETLCSLTNHAYFNLSGEFDTIHDHEVYINADTLTDIDRGLIPTGKLVPISGTPYDFSSPKAIGKDIDADDKYLNIAKGYDFNYVLRGGAPAAEVYCKKTGITMAVVTDRPCMQFYTGNFLSGLAGKKMYGYQSAFCMETQGFPNACNIKEFAPITLKAGEVYRTRTAYVFSVQK